jgi:hypothetical protein
MGAENAGALGMGGAKVGRRLRAGHCHTLPLALPAWRQPLSLGTPPLHTSEKRAMLLTLPGGPEGPAALGL